MFAEDARRATLDAAKLAGIEVIELINEITYCSKKNKIV